MMDVNGTHVTITSKSASAKEKMYLQERETVFYIEKFWLVTWK